jgi:desulfoferrodoxin (superoxide reductase-like protein)
MVHPMEEAHLIDSVDILNVSKAGLLRIKHFDLKANQEPKIEVDLSELKE